MQRPSTLVPTRRPRPLFIAVVTALLTSLLSVTALAQDAKIEKEARDLQKKAIEEDNLATDYEKASQKLSQALEKCGEDKCSTALRAELYRDLGAMQILNNKKDEGTASFQQALKLDPNLQLAAAYKTPELEAIWAQAAQPAEPTPQPAAQPEKPKQPKGDFTHTPPDSQLIRTPLPIYVEYKGLEQLVRVIARYKSYGATELKTLELKKMGNGWGAVVDCSETATTGTFQYYLQGYNANNDPVATSGNRNNTFKVQISRDKPADPPHLPGQPPPAQCQEETCPPDFPGCHDDANTQIVKKGDGEECEENYQCSSNVCRNGKCKGGESTAPGKGKKFRRMWVGLTGAFDFMSIPSEKDVCTRSPDGTEPLNAAGYDCTTQAGNDYLNPTDNPRIIPGDLNEVKGGFAPANFRILASFDYALTMNLLVGARVGYVTNTYPDKFASSEGKGLGIPLHAEARGTYLFGKEALANTGFAPMVFVGGGVSEFASSVDVTVRVKDPTAPVDAPIDPSRIRNRARKAWYVGGPGFFSVGVGARYAITPRIAVTGAAKFTGALGGVGFVPILSPELGVQYGF